jgi:hypothetical protein
VTGTDELHLLVIPVIQASQVGAYFVGAITPVSVLFNHN